MNGPRSNMPRTGDRPSLDALNRTIEGLEARIGDLMGSANLAQRPAASADHARQDPLAEIFDRQRSLEQSRQPHAPQNGSQSAAQRGPQQGQQPGRSLAEEIRERMRQSDEHSVQAAHRPHYAQQPPHQTTRSNTHPNTHQGAPYAAPTQPVQNAFDIAGALVDLRQDLKRDLSESFASELVKLRHEFMEIGNTASEQGLATEIHGDMQRLANSIEQLSQSSGNAAVRNLQGEFDSIRAMLGGLARHEDVHELSQNLPHYPEPTYDSDAVHAEIVNLVTRIDTLKAQLQTLNAEPAIRALEDKLVTIAEAIEMFAMQSPQHGNHDLDSKLVALDHRLSDIAAAIETSTRQRFSPESTNISALEDRISGLAAQIADLAHPRFEDELAQKIDSLTHRIEDLRHAQGTSLLEERLDELSRLMGTGHAVHSAAEPELNGFLSDISRKIDALDHSSVNSELLERFEYLARRIDTLEMSPPHAELQDTNLDAGFGRLEDRMKEIVARLDEAAAPQVASSADLSGLETQIANLSVLLSQQAAGGDLSGIEHRMAALEDYMTTNDEYIIEAARQAAETALEAYSRNFSGHAASSAGASAPDLSLMTGLASDLRALEDMTRAGEARTQRTFEVLQDTLIKIAERLDKMGQTAEAQQPGLRQPAMQAAAQEPAVATSAHSAYATTSSAADPIGRVMAEPAYARAYADRSSTPDVAPSRWDSDDALSPAIGESEAASSGLLGSIGKRLMPGRKDIAEKQPRRMINPAPGLDAADEISPDLANQLLEPGSGAPDIHKILERVRLSQEPKAAKRGDGDASDATNADFIAAARRAAQAAAAEMEPRQTDLAKTERPDLLSRYRRPLLLAVGAVLLAVMAYPLASSFIGRGRAPAVDQPSVANSAAAPAKSDSTSLDPTGQQTGALVKPEAALKQPEASAPSVQPPASSPAASPAQAPEAATKPETQSSAQPVAQPAEGVAAKSVVETAPVPAIAAAPAAAPELAIPAGLNPQPLVEAAQQNDPLALFEIGSRLSDGRGVTADVNAARQWYEKAAALGFAPAKYVLGNIYEKGIGVSKDIEKAKQYYLDAAKAGNISAMHNLAVLLATGDAGAPDFNAAAHWFEQAANHGVRDSEFNLAILYAKGNGVKQDLVQSYKWFGIAAKDGDQDAAQKRDEVAKVLKPEQLDAGKAAVNGWKLAPADNNANSTTVPDAWAGKPTKTSSVDMKKAIRNIQAILNKNGFDAGTPDGLMGGKTVEAIKKFQASVGQKPTGEIGEALVKALLARNT